MSKPERSIPLGRFQSVDLAMKGAANMIENTFAAVEGSAIDPAEFVPDVDEDNLDDEFTPMSTAQSMNSTGGPAAAAVSLSASRYLVLTWLDGDPEAPPNAFAPAPQDLMEKIDAAVEIVHNYDPFPLREVETTPDGLELLRQWPHVSSVFPALGNLESARRFARGLHLLTVIAETQREQRETAAFGGIEVGAKIGYPVLAKAPDGLWHLDVDETSHLPTASAVVPVVNMSVGPKSASFPYLPNDIVNLATLGASAEMLVVLAAGNCGELGMSPWAQSPWVLGVGATADEEGTRLADYSARGPADGSMPGPDLVTWGTILVKGEERYGTSYAAPRVSRCARLVTAAFLQLGRHIKVAQGEPAHGVPLVGAAFIDEYGGDIWWAARKWSLIDVPALPLVGVDQVAVTHLMTTAQAAGIPLDLRMTAGILREILVSAATPIPGYGPHEVGAGFVNTARVTARLAAVTGLELVGWFAAPHIDQATIPAPVQQELASIRVFAEDELDGLDWIVSMTGPIYFYDWRTCRMGFAPLSIDVLDSLDLDQRLSGMHAG